MKKPHILLIAALVCGGAAAYHDTGGHAGGGATLTEPQNQAVQKLLDAFPSIGALSGVGAQLDAKLKERALSPAQQQALQGLAETLPNTSALAAASARLDDKIRELTVAELQGRDLPFFGGVKDEQSLVVEFSDYQCGYCKRMFGVLNGENARVRVVEFPVLGDLSRKAASYALAARKQNLYSELHIKLMGRAERLTEDALEHAALEVGLDLEKLRKDSQSEEVTEQLRENFELARALGVRGTPFLVVGDQTSPGALNRERFVALLAQAKEKNAAKTQ
ncbi:MAG: DsbA family protein [Gammaproteobacteria bacterium]